MYHLISKRSLHSSQPSTSQSDSSSSNINDSNLLPTELEAASKYKKIF